MANENNQNNELAKWFAEEVGKLRPEQQNIALNSDDYALLKTAYADLDRFLVARDAWRNESASGNHIPIPSPKQQKTPESSQGISGIGSTVTGLGYLASTPIKLLRRDSYDKLQRAVSEQAVGAAELWEEQEKEYSKNPKLEKPKGRADNRAEAAERARNHALDTFARTDNKKAKKWAQEHPNDTRLTQAIDRVEIEKKNLTQEEYNKIRERYVERAGKGLDSPQGGLDTSVSEFKHKTAAEKELNDKLVRVDEKKAREWAKKSGDKGLLDALERKRQADIAYAKENQGRLSKLFKRSPEKKFAALPTPSNTPVQHVAPVSPGAIIRSRASTNINTGAPRSSTAVPQRRRREAGMIGRAGKAAAKSGAKKLGVIATRAILLNPLFWIIVGIVGLILFFLIYLYIEGCNIARSYPFGTDIARALGLECDLYTEEDLIPPPPPGFTINKAALNVDADGSIPNGQAIEYRITVTYDPSKANIELYPLNTLILWDRPNYPHETPSVLNPNTDNVSGSSYGWYINSYFTQDSASVQTARFDLTLRPSVEDQVITNHAFIDQASINTGGDIYLGMDSPPSSDDCGGNYDNIKTTLISRFGENWNFGDPNCSFNNSLNRLREIITSSETTEHVNQGYPDFWEDIARCESLNKVSVNNYTRAGGVEKFGIFQMRGSQAYPGRLAPQWDLDPDFARGDVTWQRQAMNAVAHNINNLGNSFRDWDSASCLCSAEPWRSQPYCARVLNRTTQQERINACTPACRIVIENP